MAKIQAIRKRSYKITHSEYSKTYLPFAFQALKKCRLENLIISEF
jgi:hypothetical protein